MSTPKHKKYLIIANCGMQILRQEIIDENVEKALQRFVKYTGITPKNWSIQSVVEIEEIFHNRTDEVNMEKFWSIES